MGRSVHQPPSARNACQARKLDLCQSFLVRAARSIRSGQDTFTGCGHVCGVLHRSSHAPLRAQGPIDSLWLPINHHKECSCWSRRMPAPLLPVLHRALIHAKVPSKLFLGHLDFLTNRPDIEMLRDVDAVLTRVCFSGGVRQGLACAGQDSAPAFDIVSDSSASTIAVRSASVRPSASASLRYAGVSIIVCIEAVYGSAV